MFSIVKTAMAATVLALGAVSVQAKTVSIASFDNGWYNDSGTHNANNTNIYTNGTYHHFLAFNLSRLDGKTVSSATVTYRENGSHNRTKKETNLSLWDVTSDLGALLTGNGGKQAYADLGDGDSYGSASVKTPKKRGPMPEFTVSLTAAAIEDINAAIDGVDMRIAIGGTIDSGSDASLWGYSNGTGAATLNVVLVPVQVPLPASGLMLLAGIGGVAALRRRRRRSQSASL